MSKKHYAVLGCSLKNPDSVIHRAEELFLQLTGNLLYSSPSPTLVALLAGTDLAIAMRTKWGTRQEHGSTADKEAFHAAISALFLLVKQLCAYVNNVTPNDPVALSTTGFPLSDDPENLPLLDAPQNLHRMIRINLGMEKAKLRWNHPTNAAPHQVITYKVLRSATASIGAATVIGEITRCTYTDVPPVSVATNYYYFVEAITAAGISEPSTPLMVQIVPLPM